MSSALTMKTVSTSETSINFYHNIRCNIQEDSHLQKTYRTEDIVLYLDHQSVNMSFFIITKAYYVNL